MAKSQATSAYRLVLVLVIIAVVIIGVKVWSGMSRENEVTTSSSSSSRAATSTSFLATTLPEDWARYDNATKDIQALTPNQTLAPFIVDDPADNDVVYFATNAWNDASGKESLGIYKYTESTYSFERIWRNSYAPGDVSWMTKIAVPVWSLAGYDNGKLIVLMADADYSPGPCAQLLLAGIGNDDIGVRLFSLDLAKPSSGLVAYTPPDTLILSATAAEKSCQDAM